MGDAMALLAGLRLDEGRLWGEAAERWQWADAMAVLEPGVGDPRLNWLGRPKGGSKSTDLAGMVVAWLVEQAPPLAEGFAVAADQEQANRLLDKARGFVARTPGLAGVLKVEASRIVNTKTMARVQALAADVASSEGLLTPFVVVDEMPNWASTLSARGMWTSVVSGLPKWPGMRLVVIGHAGDPAHWSHKVLEIAERDPMWRVNDVPGPLPWVPEHQLALQRQFLTESQFARRHLNQWVATEDRLVSDDALRECAVLEGPLRPQPGVSYVMALDVGLKNDRTVAAVCHTEPWAQAGARESSLGDLGRDRAWVETVEGSDGWERTLERTAAGGMRTSWERRSERSVARDQGGVGRLDTGGRRVVLDRMMVWSGTRKAPVRLSTVGDWLLEASRSFNGAPLVFDPYQAAGLSQRLQDNGVKTSEFTFSSASVGRLASTLHLLLRDRALVLPAEDEELLEELANVRLRETSPGVLRMDHDADKHDDRAVCLAMAAHNLLEQPPAQPATASYHGRWGYTKGRRGR